MIKILVTMDFMHDGVRYFKGETRQVSLADATRFCAAGWAAMEGRPAVQPEMGKAVILDVQNGRHVCADNLSGVNRHG